MTIAQAFDEITVQHGGTASKSGSIASAIDALNDALAGSDQQAAQDIEGAVRLLGQHIGGGSASGTISITENGEYDVSAYATADVEVSGGVEIGNLMLVVQSSVIPAIGDYDNTTSIISLDSTFVSLALGSSDILEGDSNNNFGMMPVGSNMTVGNFEGEIKVYDCTDDENWQYDSVTEITGKVTYNDNSTATIEIPSVDDGHFVVIYITPK